MNSLIKTWAPQTANELSNDIYNFMGQHGATDEDMKIVCDFIQKFKDEILDNADAVYGGIETSVAVIHLWAGTKTNSYSNRKYQVTITSNLPAPKPKFLYQQSPCSDTEISQTHRTRVKADSALSLKKLLAPDAMEEDFGIVVPSDFINTVDPALINMYTASKNPGIEQYSTTIKMTGISIELCYDPSAKKEPYTAIINSTAK